MKGFKGLKIKVMRKFKKSPLCLKYKAQRVRARSRLSWFFSAKPTIKSATTSKIQKISQREY